MVDFRCKIAEMISDVTKISKEELRNFIENPKNSEMGDYAFPCFKLAKEDFFNIVEVINMFNFTWRESDDEDCKTEGFCFAVFF